MTSSLSLSIFDIRVHVRCQDVYTYRLLKTNYAQFQVDGSRFDMNYDVGVNRNADSYFIRRAGANAIVASDEGHFMYMFEKDMTVELEKRRQDLYFIHGAALVRKEKAFLLVGQSGSGKSTLAWALSHYSFGYLSDELAPVDVATLEVLPYPHAICLKDRPAPPHDLPAETLVTSRTLHVPANLLRGGVCAQSTKLAAIFFVTYSPTVEKPVADTMSVAEAAAHLYTNALNPLAHARDGLDAAAHIAGGVTCRKLFSADAASTCAHIGSIIDGDSG